MRRWPAPTALACVLGFFAVDLGRELFLGPLLLFAACCTIVIVGALDDRSLLARALSFGGLVYVGRLSYALYLWHVPVFVALGITKEQFEPLAVVAVLISLGLAVASYHLVEQPVLRRRRRSSLAPKGRGPSLGPVPAG